METVAPGTAAPELSVTVPLMLPETACARVSIAEIANMTRKSAAVLPGKKIRIAMTSVVHHDQSETIQLTFKEGADVQSANQQQGRKGCSQRAFWPTAGPHASMKHRIFKPAPTA